MDFFEVGAGPCGAPVIHWCLPYTHGGMMKGDKERWSALSARCLEGELLPGVHAHLVDEGLWRDAFGRLASLCFPSSARLKLPECEPGLADELELHQSSYEHYVLISGSPGSPQSAEEAVGVYRGYHSPGGVYWMFTSAVDPAFQRRGIYSAVVEAVVDYAKEAGVSALLSQHRADNNPVLIAKLKAGFFISGFRISGPGLMVELALPLRPGLARAHRFRVMAEAELVALLNSGGLELDGVEVSDG